jgi:uncharacterized DUF497 family protein
MFNISSIKIPIDVTTNNNYNCFVSYEWDEAKRLSNIRKHGIDFVDVPEIFDNDTVICEDTRFEYGEPRFIVIGILKGRVIVVAYTERQDTVRIISARKATSHEQIYFFKKIFD